MTAYIPPSTIDLNLPFIRGTMSITAVTIFISAIFYAGYNHVDSIARNKKKKEAKRTEREKSLADIISGRLANNFVIGIIFLELVATLVLLVYMKNFINVIFTIAYHILLFASSYSFTEDSDFPGQTGVCQDFTRNKVENPVALVIMQALQPRLTIGSKVVAKLQQNKLI